MEDFLGNVAAELAATLVSNGAGRLRDLVWGTAEQRALERAWEAALAHRARWPAGWPCSWLKP